MIVMDYILQRCHQFYTTISGFNMFIVTIYCSLLILVSGQGRSTTPVSGPEIPETLEAILCFSRDLDYTLTPGATTSLEMSTEPQREINCTWTGIFRNTLRGHQIALTLVNLEGLDQGLNYLTIGSGSDPDDESTVLIRRTGVRAFSGYSLWLKTIFQPNEVWIRISTLAATFRANVTLELVTEASCGSDFTCEDNSCVSPEGVLNAYTDCPDGSDESPRLGFRDCVGGSHPDYVYTGDQSEGSCIPWEDTDNYNGRGLPGRVCRSLDNWPQCVMNSSLPTLCNVPPCNARSGCYQDNGSGYRDKGQFTSNGYRCINWRDVPSSVFDVQRYPDADLTDNYCRNPDGRMKPWCYYRDVDGTIQSELCSVDSCGTDGGFLEFRRMLGVTFDATTFAFRDLSNVYSPDFTELNCSQKCLAENRFTCRSFIFQHDPRRQDDSGRCIWTEVSLASAPGGLQLIPSPDTDVYVRVETECDSALVHNLPATCPMPLGMKSGVFQSSSRDDRRVITDRDISASSYLSEDFHHRFARYGGPSCWKNDTLDDQPWIQVDLHEVHIITGIVIQACGESAPGWVQEFTIQSKTADNTFISHTDQSSNRPRNTIIRGNTEGTCPRVVKFDPWIYAESIRIIPITWDTEVGLRFELLGCKENCDQSLGLTDLTLLDSGITSSSLLDESHPPRDARIQPLNLQRAQRLGWSPDLAADGTFSSWIQVNLGRIETIREVVTQGCEDTDSYLEAFTISYVVTAEADADAMFLHYQVNNRREVFNANSDPVTLVRNVLPVDLRAKNVRLNAVSWGGTGQPCMKFDLIGCPHHACGNSLGVGTEITLDSIRQTAPGNSVCHSPTFAIHGSSTHFFSSTTSNEKSIVRGTLEVTLPEEYAITGVVIQGSINSNEDDKQQWATKYRLYYARDPTNGRMPDYQPYRAIDGEDMVFNANYDSVTPVTNLLDRPVAATRLQITYYNDQEPATAAPCIRFDLLGCKVADHGYPCGESSLNAGGYCLGAVARGGLDACPDIFHPTSRPVVLSSRALTETLDANILGLYLNGFTSYHIGLVHTPGANVFNNSLVPFLWVDGTPVLYDRFDPNVVFDNSTELCVSIDITDGQTWEALSCNSPAVFPASICQLDIDECLQGTSQCSHGCRNYPGGYLCTCPPGMYLSGEVPQRTCKSLCAVLGFESSPSLNSSCLKIIPDTGFHTARRRCREIRGRTITFDELLSLLLDREDELSNDTFWIDPLNPTGNDCTVVQIDPSQLGRGGTFVELVPCMDGNTYICVTDNVPETLELQTEVNSNNITIHDGALYITWTGLPPWYESSTSANLQIRVERNFILRIYFIQANLRQELPRDCVDSLTLWENPLMGRRTKQGTYCGDLSGFYIESSTNDITLSLSIGELRAGMPPYLTVQLLYERKDCSVQECNMYCDSADETMTAPEGQLQTFNFPEILPPFYSCSWTIRLPPGAFIQLLFEAIEIPCSGNNSIRIFSRRVPGSPSLDETRSVNLCSQESVESTLLISETSNLVIRYGTGLNQQSKGFSANYSISDAPGCGVEPRETDELRCNDIRCNGPRAYIASPNYPNPYGETNVCRWHIRTPPGTYVEVRIQELTLTDPNCFLGALVFVDGEQDDVRFCGTPEENRVFVSNQNVLTIRYSGRLGNFLALYEAKEFVTSTSPVHPATGEYYCPEGWHLYDRRCFKIETMEQKLMWTAAVIECGGNNNMTTLASIRNLGDANFLHGLILSELTEDVTHIFYIGLIKSRRQTDQPTWIDGSPLSYTDWYNREYNYHEIQPDGGRIESCTAIEMRNFGRTDNWFDIPCAAETTNQFICAQPAITDFPTVIAERPSFHRENCPDGFHRIGMKCLQVGQPPAQLDNSPCPGGADMITRRFLLANNDSIAFYLEFVWNIQSDADIVVSTQTGQETFCFQRTTAKDFVLENSTCDTGTVALCSIDSTVSEQSCTLDQFSCTSGECINDAFVCDDVMDCLDGSDEDQCSKDVSDLCGPAYFSCGDNSCIHSSFICDFKAHCQDRSDELSCISPDCLADEFQCANRECIPISKRCDLIRDCVDGTDEQDCVTSDEGFQCYSGTFMPQRSFCDGFRDCTGQTFEDEPSSCDYLQSNFSCPATSLRCKNHACTSRDNLCILDHDKYGLAKGCRDLTHLQQCDRIECSDLHYKCHSSYCIPQHYRCDGKSDCPEGEDEFHCDDLTCDGAYRCKKSGACLAQHLVCDGVKQCPQGDDELFCGMECPESCVCTGLIYSCAGATWNVENVAKIPRKVKQLSMTSLQMPSRRKRQAENSVTLTIYDVALLSLEDFPFLYSLDLSSNNITDLGNGTFSSSSNLQRLNLSSNAIVFLGTTTFDGLLNLRTLDLRRNPLTVVSGSPFRTLNKLNFLSIEDSQVTVPDASFVDGLTSIQTFRSDRFYYCCLLEDSMTLQECLPPPDEFSSCTDLIRSTFQRILIWIMAISALSGNVLVIALRLLKKSDPQSRRRNSAQPVLIMNLAIADLLMGCYLLMIAIADVSYRGRYGLYSDIWQMGFFCRLAGFLSTISSVTSVLFLTVISVDRFTSVMFPLSPKRLAVKSARIVCVVLWILMIFLSALPAGIFSDGYYGRSSVCLALPITSARPSGWLYSFLLFIVLNLILLIIIVVCYSGIFIIARRSIKFPLSKTKTEKELEEEQLQIAIKVSVLVVSDILCWMPIIIMGILALTPSAVAGDVYAWTAILILPINSAVNPYLYTFLIERSRNKSKKPNYSKDTHQTPLQSADSSPALKRFAPQVLDTTSREEQGVIKAVLASMRMNRLLAPDPTERYQNFKLSAVMKREEFELLTHELDDVTTDVGKALEYLHKSGAAHGNVNEDYVIVDELYHGNKRAYLLMCAGPRVLPTTEEKFEAEVTDDELVELEVMNEGSALFAEDTKQLKELRARLHDFITKKSEKRPNID